MKTLIDLLDLAIDMVCLPFSFVLGNGAFEGNLEDVKLKLDDICKNLGG